MASKTFTVGEDVAEEKAVCGKMCKYVSIFFAIAIAALVGFFAFKTSVGDSFYGCNSPPLLDTNGFSNWTRDVEVVAFGCFPGYFVEEGQSEIVISRCVKDTWTPPPPSCNFLPLHLDCEVKRSGLLGNISMWQPSKDNATYIYGLIDYQDAVKAEGHLLESIVLSRKTCTVSSEFDKIPLTNLSGYSHMVKVEFLSDKLKAYKKADVHINMVFLDINTTATIISVKQDDVTLVMKYPDTMEAAIQLEQELEELVDVVAYPDKHVELAENQTSYSDK